VKYLCFAFAIPTALFHEKPPLFIESHPYLFWLKVYFILIECQVISANLFGVKERVFNLIILFLTFDYSISVLNCYSCLKESLCFVQDNKRELRSVAEGGRAGRGAYEICFKNFKNRLGIAGFNFEKLKGRYECSYV